MPNRMMNFSGNWSCNAILAGSDKHGARRKRSTPGATHSEAMGWAPPGPACASTAAKRSERHG